MTLSEMFPNLNGDGGRLGAQTDFADGEP